MSETFEYVFDGSDIHHGEIDVYTLAPALLAMADVFRDADRALNGQNTSVTTSVRANFKEGSFEVLFGVDQQLRDGVAALLHIMGVFGANQLVNTVIGDAWEVAKDAVVEKGPEVVKGLFKLLSKLSGEKPKDIKRDPVNGTSIFIIGNGNTISVEQSTADLYEDGQTLQSAARAASPLNRDGISDIKLKRNSKAVARLTRKDLPEYLQTLTLSPTAIDARALSSTPAPQEMIVKLIGPNFEDGKWYVSEGGKRFAVSMEDEDFKAKVHAREIGFYDGDLYRVEITTVQKVAGKRLTTRKSISRVIAPIDIPTQQLLEASDESTTEAAVIKRRKKP